MGHKAQVVAVPTELERVLANDAAAREAFVGLSASCRREYVRWIAEAKRGETRERRAREAAARMMQR